ncbi:MAG TPA: hypothetical protein VGM85_04495 [Paraburkholderia sp.]|jgi:hypothetical protein
MAAASTDPALRDVQRTDAAMRVLAACAASVACVFIVGGGAALSMQAGLGQRASALGMSALALAAMMGVPLLMARSSDSHRVLATAATLIVTMSAMNALPAYLNGLQYGGAMAASMIAAGGALLVCWRYLNGQLAKAPHHADAAITAITAIAATAAPSPGDATTLLALLAGISSGSLARFQFFALCGASGAQPLWQIALSLTAVCALACFADRARNNSMLATLYIARAALIGALAAVDHPALAPLAAKIFLLLDCLTIAALANLAGNDRRALRASCPGIAHHAGMVAGAALSSTPYFFGDGFVVLFALSAAANLICAASLATGWRGGKTAHAHANRYQRPTRSTG